MVNIGPVFGAIGRWCRRNAGRLFAGGAIGAEILGFWFMHKEAPIVRKKLDELPEDAKWIDKIKTAGPVYLPAIGMLILSSGCIVGGYVAGESKAALMAGLYTASEAALKKYEEIAVEKLGQNKVNELHEAAAEDAIRQNLPTVSNVISTGKGDQLFFDPFTANYFTSTKLAVQTAVNDINREIIADSEMWVSATEWYQELGWPEIPGCGDYVGWNVDNNMDIYLWPKETPDQRTCFVIEYTRGHRPVLGNGRGGRSE